MSFNRVTNNTVDDADGWPGVFEESFCNHDYNDDPRGVKLIVIHHTSSWRSRVFSDGRTSSNPSFDPKSTINTNTIRWAVQRQWRWQSATATSEMTDGRREKPSADEKREATKRKITIPIIIKQNVSVGPVDNDFFFIAPSDHCRDDATGSTISRFVRRSGPSKVILVSVVCPSTRVSQCENDPIIIVAKIHQ